VNELLKTLNQITVNLHHLQRRGRRKVGEGFYLYHGENEIRDAVRAQFITFHIVLKINKIETTQLSAEVIASGGRTFESNSVKSEVFFSLHHESTQEDFQASAIALGDSYKNASSTATTLALRNWMKAQFQITYDPAEDELVEEEETRGLEMSPRMVQDAKLLITRATIKAVKAKAKAAGFKPVKWNLDKMTEDDLFTCAGIAMNIIAKSVQGQILDGVSEALANE